MVNIGAFSGKTFVPFIRHGIGLRHVNFFSAAMALLALLLAMFVFKDLEQPSERKSLRDVKRALVKVLTNGRLLTLTLIVAGFWTIQSQMYATMPKFIIRMVGEAARPEWLANVNPAAVALFIFRLVTNRMDARKAKPAGTPS